MCRICNTLPPACLLLLSACFPLGVLAGNDPDPEPPAKPGLVLVLKTSTPVFHIGEVPKFTAELTNKGRKPITLVLPGDGSGSGLRTPLVTWNLAPKGGRDCGNINPLRDKEIVTLAPGKTVKLGEWLGCPRMDKPGKYKVSLTYENKPGLAWGGVLPAKHEPGAMEKVRASSPLKAVSNTIEIEMKAAKAR